MICHLERSSIICYLCLLPALTAFFFVNKEAGMIFFKFCFSSRQLSKKKKKKHNSGNFLAVNLMLREIENATTEPMQLNEFTVSHPRARNVVITICFPERTNEKTFILLKAFFLSKNKKGKKKRKGLGLRSNWIHTVGISHLLHPSSLPRCWRLRGGELISWFLEGTNIAQSFSHGDQVFRNIHWLQTRILHDLFSKLLTPLKNWHLWTKRWEPHLVGSWQDPELTLDQHTALSECSSPDLLSLPVLGSH